MHFSCSTALTLPLSLSAKTLAGQKPTHIPHPLQKSSLMRTTKRLRSNLPSPIPLFWTLAFAANKQRGNLKTQIKIPHYDLPPNISVFFFANVTWQ
jgi:hypothetical protein